MDCNKNEYNQTKCTLKPRLKGEPGPEGHTGDRGMKGEPGDMGHKGEPGSKGMKGNLGYPGYKGEKGEAGSSGIGLKGEQGSVGPKGDTGLQGPPGERGDKGDMGGRGLKGDMGLPREAGEKGHVGQKGEPGNKGMKGSLGYKGEKGIAGPQGLSQCGGTGGWRNVVLLDMTDTSHACPTGLSLTNYSRRTCGRTHYGWRSCSSTTFRVGGSQYSRVCGRAKAYRLGLNWAFYAYHVQTSVRTLGIDGSYVDGLSLTHGASGSRQHIWTFASGITTGNSYGSVLATQVFLLL